jgi:3-phosphoshikimate 1-carboxyvinyltransferase
LSAGPCTIENLLVAGVTLPLLNGLTELGVSWKLEGHNLRVTPVSPPTFRLEPGQQEVVIDCGNSATTIRLFAGALAGATIHGTAGAKITLDGSEGLRRRPMGRIVEPLRQMGVSITAGQHNGAPLQIVPNSDPANPRLLHAISHHLPVASAQVKSCLLLAGLSADGETVLYEPGPSRDHTERMLRSLGVQITTERGCVRMQPPKGPLPAFHLRIPGDFSAAAFLITAALLVPGSDLTLVGVGLNPTRTGLLDVLKAMGGDIEVSAQGDEHGEPVGNLRIRHSALRGITVQGDTVVRMIDEFPVFAVAAACATGETVVQDAEELRHKESDRITALRQLLGSIGVVMEETKDGFRLPGSTPPHGGKVDARGDHRLAMSMAIAGLCARDAVQIHGAEISDESFPGFFDLLASLGAEIGK